MEFGGIRVDHSLKSVTPLTLYSFPLITSPEGVITGHSNTLITDILADAVTDSSGYWWFVHIVGRVGCSALSSYGESELQRSGRI